MSVNLRHSNTPPSNTQIILFRIILFILTTFSLLILILFIAPYEITSTYLNQLASDGHLESFTIAVYQTIRIPILLIGSGILILLIMMQVRLQPSVRRMKRILRFFINQISKFLQGWRNLYFSIHNFCTPKICLILAGLTLLAFIVRIFLINRPMQHDEAYSAVVFAFEQLKNGLSDYHFPNNHVFHTLLVHITYKLFGPFEWVVRLPAFIASVLLSPFGFILAKRWYRDQIAVISAIFIAVFPPLIHYAVNARGYSLMALFTVILFILGDFVKNKNNPAAWFLIALTGALGFYTLPIMAYPLAFFYGWLGLVWIFKLFNQQYSMKSFLFNFFMTGILTSILGLGFYIPIFLNWGFGSIFANPYVSSMDQTLYLQTLQSRLSELWTVLNQGIVPGFGIFLILGFILSLIFHRKTSRETIPLQIVSLLTFSMLIAIQRPNIFARTWVFYYPLMLIWVTAGWLSLIDQIGNNNLNLKRLRIFFISLFSLIIIVNGISYVKNEYPTSQKYFGDVEQATMFLADQLNPDDIVVITATDDAAMWFFFEKYKLGREFFLRNRPFHRAFVVTTRSKNQTVEEVIQERGPDLVFFNMQTVKRIERINDLDLYRIEANHQLIEKTFGH